MELDLLYWEASSFEKLRIYFGFFMFLILCAAVFSNEMKRKNKIIVSMICISLLLFLPFARRMEIRNYVDDQGYTLLVDKSDFISGFFMNYQYGEAESTDCLRKPFLYGFELEHENKLILVYWTKGPLAPRTLDEIDFLE